MLIQASVGRFASLQSKKLAWTSTLWTRRFLCAQTSSSLLNGNIDRFGGVSVTLTSQDANDSSAFQIQLRKSLASWRGDGRCAVWVRVPTEAAVLLPILLKEGFDWHHAQPHCNVGAGAASGYAMLTQWLKDGPSALPQYAKHQVGVGGLVLNADGEVLLIQEKVSINAKVHGMWKLPGGLVDPGEDLVDAAVREVLEETGVRTRPEGILCIHHRHGYRFNVSDLYFTVRMRAVSRDFAADPNEVSALTWMPLHQARIDPGVMEFNKLILSLVDQQILLPHRATHGTSRSVEHYLYTAASALPII